LRRGYGRGTARPTTALTVMRWSPDGYVTLLRAERGETVRPEPFPQIELAVGTLFGDDPPER
jgi:hypothetical protein